MKNVKVRRIHLAIGPLLYLLCCLCLPSSVFETVAAKSAIGTVIWMAYWWVTGPVDYAVTAFLPIGINALNPMTTMSKVLANYSSETIVLLLGASIIIVAWDETGLDSRIAAKFLSLVGSNFRGQLVFWFMLSMILSTVLPNAVVCATITPLAVAMLKYVGKDNMAESKEGSKLLLYIAYATGIGGLASPLGGAMNLVTVQYLEEITGQEYIYSSWVVRFFPAMVILVILSIIFMLRDVKKEDSLGGAKEFFVMEYQKMPPMTMEELGALILFAIAVILSFTRQFYQAALPDLKPAYVFAICSILSFLLIRKDGSRVMQWKKVQGKIVWELIFIFAGGLAAGSVMSGSGAVDSIAAVIAESGSVAPFMLVFGILFLTLMLSDVTSNTATAAVAMPIVISIVNGMGLNPIPYIYIASIGVNLSFMLPTSIRAIPVGYGLSPAYMLKEGAKISVAVIITMSLLGYLLLTFWPAFSTI